MARSIVAVVGVIVALTRGNLGPSWYPIAIAVTAYPCTWLGGRLGVTTPA